MDQSVRKYFDSVAADREPHMTALHKLITDLYPDVIVDMSYKMPTYRRGDGWVALASQKRYVSLYTCGAHHLARFKERHPEIKTGKGCINFKAGERLPLADVRQVVKHAIEHSKG